MTSRSTKNQTTDQQYLSQCTEKPLWSLFDTLVSSLLVHTSWRGSNICCRLPRSTSHSSRKPDCREPSSTGGSGRHPKLVDRQPTQPRRATSHCRWDDLRAIQPLRSRLLSSFSVEPEESGVLWHFFNGSVQIGTQMPNSTAPDLELRKPYPHTILTQ